MLGLQVKVPTEWRPGRDCPPAGSWRLRKNTLPVTSSACVDSGRMLQQNYDLQRRRVIISTLRPGPQTEAMNRRLVLARLRQEDFRPVNDDSSGLDLEVNLPKRGNICCAEMAAMEAMLLRHMSAGKRGLDAAQTLLYADRNLRSS